MCPINRSTAPHSTHTYPNETFSMRKEPAQTPASATLPSPSPRPFPVTPAALRLQVPLVLRPASGWPRPMSLRHAVARLWLQASARALFAIV